MRTARSVDPAFIGFGHRRTRPGMAKSRERSEDVFFEGSGQPQALRFLLVLESEGVIFDSPGHEAAAIHGPAFESVFSWGLEPGICAAVWRQTATRSRWRGEDAFSILKASLAKINGISPSLRRSAVLRYLDSLSRDGRAAEPCPSLLMPSQSLEATEPEILYTEWFRLCEGLKEEAGPSPLVPGARDFLADLPGLAPQADILVYSNKPESLALNRWEVAGLSSGFSRLAGSERGSFPEYLYSALQHGYARRPILVIGSSLGAWKAAQRAQARFYPLIFREVESGAEAAWSVLRSTHLPEYLKARDGVSAWPMAEFLSMLAGEPGALPLRSGRAGEDKERPCRGRSQALDQAPQTSVVPCAEDFWKLG